MLVVRSGGRKTWILWMMITAAFALQLSIVAGEYFKPFNVSYDHRALILDGKRRILISAGIHYPRATPEVLFFFDSSALHLDELQSVLFFLKSLMV